MTVARIGARVVVASVVVFALAVVALGACGSSAGPATSSGGSGAAPALKGGTLGGGTFDLAATIGKPTVVNFFASWCGPCNEEAPQLVAFAKAHPDVQVVGVATNDKVADAQAFVSKYAITFPVVMDPNGDIGDAWGVTGIPTTFFIDKSGNVRASIVGASTQAQFEHKLATIE
jgi:thiol-disulfide isomerase/thioredoxin